MRNTEMVLLDILFQDLKIILLSRIYIYIIFGCNALNTSISSPPGVSALDVSARFHVAETPNGNNRCFKK